MVLMVDEALLLPTLDSLPQQLVILDGDGAVVTVNRAWREFRRARGLPSEPPVGVPFAEVLYPGRSRAGCVHAGHVPGGVVADDHEAVVEGVGAVLARRARQFECTVPVTLCERTLWFEVFAVTLPAARPGVVVSLFDVTEERESARHLRVAADHDALTGLPNRRAFEREAERALSLAGRRGSTAAVVFLDLDEFKAVNDTLGHAAGDEVLLHVTESLRAEMRASDVLARWGGDEFVLLLPDLQRDRYDATVERFRAALSRPLDASRHGLEPGQQVRASFGAAFFPEDGGTLAELLNHADEAMYRDKAAGRGFGRRGAGVVRVGRAAAGGSGGGRYQGRPGSVRAGRTPNLLRWLWPKEAQVSQ